MPRPGVTGGISCSPQRAPTSGGGDRTVRASDVIVGRQNVDVTLTFTGTTFTSSAVSTNATVTDLLSQPMGTTDGVTTTANGTRVFFVSGPTVTNGSGLNFGVSIANADGTCNCTGLLQSYFQYTPLIPAGGTSAVKNWRFNVNSGLGSIESFSFQVEVDAALPAEASARRWTILRQGITGSSINGIWEHTPTDIYAVGNATGTTNTILHNDGTGWSFVNTGLALPFGYQAVFGVSGTDLWTVGGGGAAVHFNGTAWSKVTVVPSITLNGVWGSSPSNYITVGNSLALYRYNGSSWSAMTPPGGVAPTVSLRALWGSDSSHVFAVGDNGTILLYNGSTWTTMTSPTTQQLLGVWGTSSTSVFAAGLNGVILKYDGSAWSAMASPVTTQLNAIGGTAANDVWAVGDAGTTLHFNGIAWSSVASVSGFRLTGVTSGQAGQTTAYAIGLLGTFFTYDGTSWALSDQSGPPINGIWADTATDVWAASSGTALHYNGAKWTTAYVGAKEMTNAIWGFASPSLKVFGAGNFGNASLYNSTSWTVTNTLESGLNGIWGDAAVNVYAVGTSGAVTHYNGTSWSNQTPLTAANLTAVWGSAALSLFSVADDGEIWHFTGGPWAAMASGVSTALYAVSGSSATNVWSVGAAGVVLHYTGTTWSPLTSGVSTALRGVYAAAPSDVYAAGDSGVVAHYNGSSWLSMPPPSSLAKAGFQAVFGTSTTNVYVAGANGVVMVGTQ